MGCSFNSIVFPKPREPKYKITNKSLIWIPRDNGNKDSSIPGMFIPGPDEDVNKVMVFFHGNAEDIGVIDNFLGPVAEKWKTHALAVEYPTYGQYKNNKISLSETQIKKDALHIIDYLKNTLMIQENQIIVFGRSMGTGPSSYIAAERPEIHSLILFSPFKSVRFAAKAHVGGCGCLVEERFKNYEEVKKFKGPVIIIHGKKDKVIPFEHSEVLFKAGLSTPKVFLKLPDADHNSFRLDVELISPVLEFYESNNLQMVKGAVIDISMFTKLKK